jgi:adenylate cyclase
MSTSFRSFFSDLRKKRIIEILAAFIAGGWLIIEFVDRILVAHYHFPDKTIDITFITLLCALLCMLLWRWFSGREKPRKFKLELVLIPLVVLVTVFLDINLLLHLKGPESENVPAAKWKNSIAVLPFVDMSPQKDQEYFCDGMTEELINRLSNVRELRVPARTSAFFFKGREQDIREIGRKLDVNTVLEGSVRRAGNELRITAQLVNIADGYHLWSQTYDRELQDIFALQDEISLQIINKLKIEFLGEERARVAKRYTDNTEAYDSYMRGMWLCNNKSTEGDWRKAILYFERAAEIDPNFSLAYVELALGYFTLSLWHFVSTDEVLPKIKRALEHALKIDPGLPEALALSGRIKTHYEYDWIGGESDIKKALEVNPNLGVAHLGMASILLDKGQIDKAIEENSAFLEFDPLSLVTQGVSSYVLYKARRYDDAIKLCQKSIELESEYWLTLATLGLCYVQKSEFEEAIAALQKAVSVSGNSTEPLCYLAYAYVVSGNREKGIEILREIDKLSEHTYVTKYYLASVQAALGDKDKAFELLELAYKERDADLTGLKTDPKFAVLRSDPRFEMILKKIGMEK